MKKLAQNNTTWKCQSKISNPDPAQERLYAHSFPISSFPQGGSTTVNPVYPFTPSLLLLGSGEWQWPWCPFTRGPKPVTLSVADRVCIIRVHLQIQNFSVFSQD